MIDKNSLRRRFSASASSYDSYALVQKKMAQKLIGEVKAAAKKQSNLDVLEIGCGTGYMTGLLLQELENAKLHALDIAPGMIEEASKKFGRVVEFRCEDVENADFECEYDLIVSNATFQWLNEIESTFSKLAGCLKTGGFIVFSTFGEKNFWELNEAFKKAKLEKNSFDGTRLGQSFYSLPELKLMLERSAKSIGLKCKIKLEEKMEYQYFDSSKEFLHSIKKIGANSKSDMLTNSPGIIKRTMEIYNQSYREKEKIRASYHCIYVTVER